MEACSLTAHIRTINSCTCSCLFYVAWASHSMEGSRSGWIPRGRAWRPPGQFNTIPERRFCHVPFFPQGPAKFKEVEKVTLEGQIPIAERPAGMGDVRTVIFGTHHLLYHFDGFLGGFDNKLHL